MQFNPLVSVIIHVFSVEKFLDNGLNFIVMQTHKNLKKILIDDGSTYNSTYICDKCAKKDARIEELFGVECK